MNRKIALVGALFIALAANLAAQDAPQRRALLIGINNYRPDHGLPRLRGPRNDVDLVGNLLRTRLGFDDVRVLPERQATRAGILGALAKLVAESGPDDTVWIHYSGHGSQAPDLNGDESDGIDETLVPIDGGRLEGDTPDILDDELDEVLAGFRTDDVILVFDSCHSGTATRLAVQHVTKRFARPDSGEDRRALYEALPAANAQVRPSEPRFVFFAAAKDDEEALGAQLDGLFHGLFTRALVAALSNGTEDQTPRQVLTAAAQEYGRLVARISETPTTPQLEAPRSRLDRPLLAPRRTQAARPEQARLTWVPISHEGDEVLLRDGAALGAAPSSTWALYPPDDDVFVPGAAVASGTVSQIRGRDAVLQLDPGTAQPSRLHDYRGVRIAAPPSADHVAVRLAGDPDDCAPIETALRERVPHLRTVDEAEFARFVLDVRGERCTLHGAGGGEPLLRDTTDLGEVARIVSRSMVADALLQLENAASGIELRVRATNRPPTEERAVSRRRVAVEASRAEEAAYVIYRDDAPPSPRTHLQLAIETDQDCYVTIVSVDSAGGVYQLFPFPRQNPEFLPQGLVPGSETVLIPEAIPSQRSGAGFDFAYREPAGLDTVKVFATTDLGVAERIRAAVKQIENSKAAADEFDGARARRTALEELRRALTVVATRGIVPEEVTDRVAVKDTTMTTGAEPAPADPTPRRDWAAASINIRVRAR